MAVERGVGDEVLTRLEHDLARPLSDERRLDRGQDRVGPDRELLTSCPET